MTMNIKKNVNGDDYDGNYPELLLLKNQKIDSNISLNLQRELSLDEEVPLLLTIDGYVMMCGQIVSTLKPLIKHQVHGHQ